MVVLVSIFLQSNIIFGFRSNGIIEWYRLTQPIVSMITATFAKKARSSAVIVKQHSFSTSQICPKSTILYSLNKENLFDGEMQIYVRNEFKKMEARYKEAEKTMEEAEAKYVFGEKNIAKLMPLSSQDKELLQNMDQHLKKRRSGKSFVKQLQDKRSHFLATQENVPFNTSIGDLLKYNKEINAIIVDYNCYHEEWSKLVDEWNERYIVAQVAGAEKRYMEIERLVEDAESFSIYAEKIKEKNPFPMFPESEEQRLLTDQILNKARSRKPFIELLQNKRSFFMAISKKESKDLTKYYKDLDAVFEDLCHYQQEMNSLVNSWNKHENVRLRKVFLIETEERYNEIKKMEEDFVNVEKLLANIIFFSSEKNLQVGQILKLIQSRKPILNLLEPKVLNFMASCKDASNDASFEDLVKWGHEIEAIFKNIVLLALEVKKLIVKLQN